MPSLFSPPHEPVALRAPSGAVPAGFILCVQQHLLNVPLLAGRGDLLLAPVVTGTLGTVAAEVELDPGTFNQTQLSLHEERGLVCKCYSVGLCSLGWPSGL